MKPRTDRQWDYADDTRYDREPEPWSSVRCACGARYRCAPFGDAPRWQCETCETEEGV